jgi:hypothetical protein
METECASLEVRTGLYVLLQVASISQLTVRRLSRQCENINISQCCRPPRPVTGIALLFIAIIPQWHWFIRNYRYVIMLASETVCSRYWWRDEVTWRKQLKIVFVSSLLLPLTYFKGGKHFIVISRLESLNILFFFAAGIVQNSSS